MAKTQSAAPRIWRPDPPSEVLAHIAPRAFAPADELAEWAMNTFIAEDAQLLNEEHAHLRSAHIGMLWTSIPNSRQMRTVVGMAELGQPRGSMGKWPKARAVQQMEDWFGIIPDFLITIDAQYATQCEDAEFCSLIEHELLHCGQEKDEWGQPRFSKQTGRPVFGMRGHDVSEFVSIVARYGAAAAGSDVVAMVEAAKRAPLIAPANLAEVCGTCLAKAA